MVGGTASHAGKSWMATAICRYLYRRGLRVAPFKAQNMSNNSYPCVGGGEIGRAQVAQAEACGLEPEPDMNPILLKPTGERGSQVVVHGKVWRTLSARDYYKHHDYLAAKTEESFERLAKALDFIVVEGAGSITELNLRRTDLVNLGFARRFGVPVLLVADIDRGGVFASVHGTIDLLEPDERELVRSFAANRFRGDPALFVEGTEILERKTDTPCLGVFPYAPQIHLDAEDSVVLDEQGAEPHDAPPVAILRFPRVSNLADFRLLRSARWVDRPCGEQFDAIILPGSKSPADDLMWMRAQGLDRWIVEQHAKGTRIVGICGGYQILGKTIDDPHGVESGQPTIRGLDLLPVQTTLAREKVTRRVSARTVRGHAFTAYEIHVGRTEAPADVPPLAYVEGRPAGAHVGNCLGCYLHGALEEPEVVEEWLGFRPAILPSKEDSYDALGQWFAKHADTKLFDRLYLGASCASTDRGEAK